ncbi:MAG: hypothetical protein JXR78_19135 [Victivallales bacterium]|nr:hypothetical protein [Victivallales bacterium]
MNPENISIKRPELEGVVSLERGLSFEFRSGASVLTLRPVSLGGFSEAEAMMKKFRRHASVDGLSSSVETMAVIPFGIEPEIRRNIEFAANHAKVITDISMKGGMPVKNIALDDIKIDGEVKRVGIIPVNTGLESLPQVEWHDAGTGEQVFYHDADPFLICLVEMVDGGIWEVGAGDDLWRWNCGSKYNAGTEFKIFGDAKGIKIIRNVYVKKEESLPPQRGLRFKWYFAWSVKDNAPDAQPGSGSYLDLMDMEMPEEGKVMLDEDKFSAAPCFEANALRKRFRSMIRSLAGGATESAGFTMVNVEPHICLAAAHLDRGKKRLLLHWDILNIMDQWLWANRLLLKSGSNLRFYATGKDIQSLPSIYGMKNVFEQEDSE